MPLMTRDKKGTRRDKKRNKQGQNRDSKDKQRTVGTSREKVGTIRDNTGTAGKKNRDRRDKTSQALSSVVGINPERSRCM